MELTNLRSLYGSMTSNNVKRAKFEVVYKNVHFDCIYFIDTTPHSLAIGVKVKNFYIEVPVHNGFKINTYLGDKYSQLYNLLDLQPNGNEKYSPTIFFTEINNRLPLNVKSTQVPKPSDTSFFRRNVEEKDKVYFIGWLEHSNTKKRVSKENLDKTRKLLDEDAYIMCASKNISSRWSDNPSLATKFVMPK